MSAHVDSKSTPSLWSQYLYHLDHSPLITKSLTAAFLSAVSEIIAQLLSDVPINNLDYTSLFNQILIGLFIRGPPVHYWYLLLDWLFVGIDNDNADGLGSKQVVNHSLSSSLDKRRDSTAENEEETVEMTSMTRRSIASSSHSSTKYDDKDKPISASSTSSARPSWTVVLGKTFLDQTTFGPFFNWLYFFVLGFLQGDAFAVTQAKIATTFVPTMIENYKVWPLVSIVNFKFIPTSMQVLFGNIISVFWMVYFILITK